MLDNQEVKRTETEVFKDLDLLCHSDGYLHVIAYFCFRDNAIRCGYKVEKEDFLKQYEQKGLLRIEISTLIGLACKDNINIHLPSPSEIQKNIDRTEMLLEELHHSMFDISDMLKFNEDGELDKNFNPMTQGKFLREPIFYGGESAYHFQYRDFSKIKYLHDEKWLIDNKGYNLRELFEVIDEIGNLQLKKINNILSKTLKKHPNEWTVLDAFVFTVPEIKAELSTSISEEVIQKIIESFVSTDSYQLNAMDDFNPKNAFPIIKIDESRYLLFQNYSLLESLYESPFFWFWNDKSYRNIAMENRGNFTEKFSTQRLKSVFGDNKVFQGVNILDKNGKTVVGEIDVLVLFANRAIVVQAKSKKLTVASRKGDDQQLRSDFKKAIQDAYDQAFLCSSFLLDKAYKLVDLQENEIDISNIELQEIYPVCVVSDHYPALFFQTKQFLKYKETEKIKPPFVMDIFFLDVFAEMLNTPLYFLSYLERRVSYVQSISTTHEMTVLAYHLKHNLWFDNELGKIYIAEDFNTELDMSMLTRRDGLNSIRTPEGILTKYKGTTLGNYLSQIEKLNNPNTIDFGFLILQLSEEAVIQINDGIKEITRRTLLDKRNHDLTMAFDEGGGITIHSSFSSSSDTRDMLEEHARARKYYTKSNNWHAICIDPITKSIKFGIKLDFPWEYSEKMEQATSLMAKPLPTVNFKTQVRPKKIGRNEPCPCGSGKKHKKCCL